MQFNSDRNISNITLFLLIQPFAGVLVALKHYRESWSKNMIWFFIAFYGFTLVISNTAIDANRVRDALSVWHHTRMNFSNFTELFFSESSGFIDFVQPLSMFIVSRFTDNHNILFGFYGLIFGFFYSRNIWYLFDHLKENDRFFNLLLIKCYFL